jgi:hypothetical protein
MAEPDPRVNPAAMALPDAARLLSKAAGQVVPLDMLEQDVAEGTPTTADGTINLLFYAAWLVKEAAGAGD